MHESVLHIPVMLDQVIAALTPKNGKFFIDATFGNGGYSRALLDAGDCHVAAIDRDPDAISAGQSMVTEYNGRLTLFEGTFSHIAEHVANSDFEMVDGIVFDLGVCSTQIDRPERGFSFRFDGPLDMRMSKQGQNAGEIINNFAEDEIADILWRYGEERASRRIARAIVEARLKNQIDRTIQLAEIIRKTMPRPKPGQIDSATRTFQALRIYINGELDELLGALHACKKLLKPGGILVVVSFHSLEDRIVKQFMAEQSGYLARPSRHRPDITKPIQPLFQLASRKPSRPSLTQIADNSRSRSAKLRIATRTDVPALSYPPPFEGARS